MCLFCEPEKDEKFLRRKLKFEDPKGYWYAVVPKEIGSFGQIMLIVTKREEDYGHITDIADCRLRKDPERLSSILKGLNEISDRIKCNLRDQNGRKVEKVYVLTQCENEHLHFHLYPRFECDPVGNEFLYSCELEEARWADSQTIPPCKRLKHGEQIIQKHMELLRYGNWAHDEQFKKEKREEYVRILNAIL